MVMVGGHMTRVMDMFHFCSFVFLRRGREGMRVACNGTSNWNGCTGYDSFFSDPFLLSFSTYLSSIASSME